MSSPIVRLWYAMQLPGRLLAPLYPNFRGAWGSYRPFFQPWREDAAFQDCVRRARGRTLYSEETLFQVWQYARACARVDGEFWECGVYRGASSLLLAEARRGAGLSQSLRLFDTFTGIPEQGEHDKYRVGALGDTSLAGVKAFLEGQDGVCFHPGLIPGVFAGLEDRRIAFALVDVDQEASTLACLEFIYPRLSRGGMIMIDDYGRPGTYGCRLAVDGFRARTDATLVVLNTGQGLLMGERG
jgi:O-methyltransferase